MRAVKKTWVLDEDKALLRLIELHGLSSWYGRTLSSVFSSQRNNVMSRRSIIAASMDNRTGKQCRERYFNHLQPNIKKGNWTDDEDQTIVTMQAKIGNQWSAMTKYLPGRTDNAIKNRWHAIVKAQQAQQDQNSDYIGSESKHSFQNGGVLNNHEVKAIDQHQYFFGPTPSTQIYNSSLSLATLSSGSGNTSHAPFEYLDSGEIASPFKPSRMPAPPSVGYLFDIQNSRVADVLVDPSSYNSNFVVTNSGKFNNGVKDSNPNRFRPPQLDIAAYVEEKDIDNTFNLPTTTSIGTIGTELETINPNASFHFFKDYNEDNFSNMFDFSSISLDTLDMNNIVGGSDPQHPLSTNTDTEFNLPTPIDVSGGPIKTFSVLSGSGEDDYDQHMSLSMLLPRTPRSPMLMNLKRSRF